MSNQFSLVISCRHDRPGMIVQTQDGEHVCTCGVVLEERTPEPPAERPESRASLYHQVEAGGLPADMAATGRRIHVHRPASSDFSNLCGKLRVPGFAQHRAWQIYRTMRASTDHTRAKCASFAIHLACREAGCPVWDGEVAAAICAAMGVRNAPNMLSVISELHDDAARLGIDSNERRSDDYYLNGEMARRQGLFGSEAEYDAFRAAARENFANMGGNQQCRARRASEMALIEMGVEG